MVSLIAVAAALAAGAYAGTHLYAGARAAAAQPIIAVRASQPAPPAVITGRVAAVRGATATIVTPNRSVCPPPATPAAGSTVRCNAIVAGASVQVDTARAVFETPAGVPVRSVQPRLAVGDAVVVVGAPTPNTSSTTQGGQQVLHATVIQRVSPCAGH